MHAEDGIDGEILARNDIDGLGESLREKNLQLPRMTGAPPLSGTESNSLRRVARSAESPSASETCR